MSEEPQSFAATCGRCGAYVDAPDSALASAWLDDHDCPDAIPTPPAPEDVQAVAPDALSAALDAPGPLTAALTDPPALQLGEQK